MYIPSRAEGLTAASGGLLGQAAIGQLGRPYPRKQCRDVPTKYEGPI
jgi:hypothetical protein